MVRRESDAFLFRCWDGSGLIEVVRSGQHDVDVPAGGGRLVVVGETLDG